MQYYNVCTCKEYKDKNGEQKTSWYKAGVMKINPETNGRFLQLFHQPETTFFLFEQDEDRENLRTIE